MSNQKGFISPEQAKKLNDAYTARCELISRDITKRPDNRSSWYSLEDIENFLTYAKAQAKELGYEMDGIRIYCGAYEPKNGRAGYSTSGKRHDLQGVNGLNLGQHGDPPGANYPQ